MRQILVAIALTLLTLPALRADVTLRYKMEVKMNPGLSSQVAEQMKKSMADTFEGSTHQFRDGKGLSTFGAYTYICDFTKQMVTVLDPKGKRYATASSAQYTDEISRITPQQPAETKVAMAAMKGHFQSKPVTRTATIQGVEAEEREFEISIDPPPTPNLPSGPTMRMVMRVWIARSSEVMRVPAIREIAGYNLFASVTMNPIQAMEKVTALAPGLGSAFTAWMKELQSSTGVVLRMEIEQYSPMISMMMKQHPESTPLGAGFDPDSPIMQLKTEMVEISTAAIPDSVFQIPEGFQSAPVADLVKDLVAAQVKGFVH